MRFLVSVLFLSTTIVLPVLAADLDYDGLDDSITGPSIENQSLTGQVAIVDTGDGSVGNYTTRLTGLGYTVSTIPVNSGYATMINYDAVLLPTSHGAAATNATFAGLAGDYHQYVQDGGCLYIGQPNPFNMPGSQSAITWAPYALTVSAWWEGQDCPPEIVDPNHCVTQGMGPNDMAFPADQVVSMAADWTVLARGPFTLSPSLFTAAYGNGNVMVELAHPSPNSVCPFSDAGLDRMMSCCLGGGATPVGTSTWGAVKAVYR